uniref:NAD(P)-binding protein n=1 Tax=Caenorhabditis japonica TaxID=281687 RepID=A0A8R1E2A6_CAEJA
MPCALVIGATSTLGKAVVRRLAFAGYKVAATSDCPNSVGKVAEDNKKVGGDVTAFSLDTSKSEHRKELVEKVTEKLGGLDTLVIVPQQNTIVGEIIETSGEDFDKLFADTLTTPFRISQAALPQLSKSKNGSIVFLTSCFGFTPSIDMGLFSVASNSVLSLTKAVASSAAKKGVRVNSVVSGMVEGDGTGAVWDNASGEEARQIRQQLESMIPLGRLGRPADVASYVEFLASSKARYITGENCIVGGGVSYRL